MCEIFNLEEHVGSCGGSLHVYGDDGTDHVFTTTDENTEVSGIGIVSSSVSMEGCGCYTLYQGQGRRGRAYYVTRRGRQEIPLGRVGSVYQHTCGLQGYRNASTTIVNIVIVVVIVLIVGVGIGLIVRKRKQQYIPARSSEDGL